MKFHVVIDARESGTTTGRYIDKLIEHLAKLDTTYSFTALTKSPRVEYLKKVAPNFKIVRSDIKEFTFGEQIDLLRQINSLNPDLVFFSIVQQPIFYRGRAVTMMHDLTTLRFKNPTKNPVIFSIKQYIYGYVNRVAARKSLAVITPSKFVKDDVAKYVGVDKSKITVTYESADKITVSAKAFKKIDGDDFILYVGRPQPHKNLKRLIEAHQHLLTKNPNLKLCLVGKKNAVYKQLEEYTDNRDIKNVVFADFVDEGELRWLYENALAYVFPSLSEGFGLPGLEAMAHGCPVVSSNATCLPEVYGEAAHYFDPGDVADMAQKISEVLDDKKLRQKLIEKGHKQVKKYSWEKMAKQTLEIYEKALKSNT